MDWSVSLRTDGPPPSPLPARTVFFIIRRNSSSLISPSPSRSASSIISANCAGHGAMEKREGGAMKTTPPSCLGLASYLLVCHVFTKLFRDTLEIAEADLALLVVVK
jgi:hypothetical protein